MSPAITPISPVILKTILEKDGFHVERETETNWTLFKEDSPCPVIIVPKKGKLVSVTVMMGILAQIQMDNKKYFSLLKQVNN